MISVDEAKKRVVRYSKPLGVSRVALRDSLGHVLAENIRAPFAMPLFDNAAMDGFVLSSKETETATPAKPLLLNIKGSIKAGDIKKVRVKQGETYRIMTGAPIPEGADTVLPKENADVEENYLVITGLVRPEHIRWKGEEIRKDARVLPGGCVINPAIIGVLASLGHSKILVFRKPGVSVIATGNELVRPGNRLKRGQIFDSNSYMISSALEKMGCFATRVMSLKDNAFSISSAITKSLRRSDITIMIGGVSVGDYDLVKDVLQKAGVASIFWKVAQKPGKPLFFGHKGEKLVFGLPGNPAAALTCFYEYVYPSLRLRMGYSTSEAFLLSEQKKLGSHVIPDERRALFLKARVNHQNTALGSRVEVLSRQGSHMISAFAESNALAFIPAGGRMLQKGQKVSVHRLPQE